MAKNSRAGRPKKALAKALKPLRKKRLGSTQTTASTSSHSRLSIEERTQLQRLAEILPSRASNSTRRLDELQLVNDAAKYIRQLTATVMARVRNGTLPPDALRCLQPDPSLNLESEQQLTKRSR
ncbi:Protein Y65A5A.1 [Aphelenchoides avenae]|nr:Protein Y65A5A.1 [Aphelenchus avenae]